MLPLLVSYALVIIVAVLAVILTSRLAAHCARKDPWLTDAERRVRDRAQASRRKDDCSCLGQRGMVVDLHSHPRAKARRRAS